MIKTETTDLQAFLAAQVREIDRVLDQWVPANKL